MRDAFLKPSLYSKPALSMPFVGFVLSSVGFGYSDGFGFVSSLRSKNSMGTLFDWGEE
jgi:hypothetical protein